MDKNFDLQPAERAQAPEESSWNNDEHNWVSNVVHDAWSTSNKFGQSLANRGENRFEIAAQGGAAAALATAAGAIGVTIGTLALPIHGAGRLLGLCDKQRIEDDTTMLKNGAELLLDAPVLAAWGAYTLIDPPQKQKR